MAGKAVVGAGSVADMDLAGEVVVTPLWGVLVTPSVAVVALVHSPEGSAAAALVRFSAGPVDFRVEVRLVEEITAASLTGVSVDAIATFASLMETFSISASLASDTQIITPITTHTPIIHTRIITRTPITTMIRILGADQICGLRNIQIR
jgi:hypothetical protein